MSAPDPISQFVAAWSSYPPWLVVGGAAAAAAALLWLLGKVLRWALWLLAIAVLVVGGAMAIWLIFAR
jgi:hypothetical protein